MNNFRFIDLFAGLGGFHLAAASLGGHCVFASELQEDLRSIYQKNFETPVVGDIRAVAVDDVPDHDLLCAGFPCQPFSKAGRQLGWKDAVRGTVFFCVAEILEHKRPEMVILENVPNFIHHDRGNTYKRVVAVLEALDYQVQSAKLSPHQFGVPQIRERMFIVARQRRAGGLARFSWPAHVDNALDVGVVLDSHPADAKAIPDYLKSCLGVWQEFLEQFPAGEKLPSFPLWTDEFGANYPTERDSLCDYSLSDLRTFCGSFGAQLSGKTKAALLAGVPNYARSAAGAFPGWKQRFIRQNREFYDTHRVWLDQWIPKIRQFPHSLRKFEWNCQGEVRDLWRHLIQIRASGVRVRRRATAPSLVAMTTTQVPIVGWEQRYMTVRECARLQSMGGLSVFPDRRELAFKALGNAVNVQVVRAVLGNLLCCPRTIPPMTLPDVPDARVLVDLAC